MAATAVRSLLRPLNGPTSALPALGALLHPNWSRTASALCKSTSGQGPCWALALHDLLISCRAAPPSPIPPHSNRTGLPHCLHLCYAPSCCRNVLSPGADVLTSFSFTQRRPFPGALPCKIPPPPRPSKPLASPDGAPTRCMISCSTATAGSGKPDRGAPSAPQRCSPSVRRVPAHGAHVRTLAERVNEHREYRREEKYERQYGHLYRNEFETLRKWKTASQSVISKTGPGSFCFGFTVLSHL